MGVSLCLSVILLVTRVYEKTNFVLLDYIRALSILAFLTILSTCFVKFVKNNLGLAIKKLLQLCSKYSLQMYIFNGFILVPARLIVCKVMHISNPVIIVVAIVLANIVITLLLCELIIPRLPILPTICGLERRKK